MSRRSRNAQTPPPPDPETVARGDAALRKVSRLIKSGQAKRIIVLTGAGISTSAGIPDFRSPTTGLYANLARLNLPYPTAVFELDYFKRHPEPFWILAKDLYPGKYLPTPTHYFLSLLHTHSILQRVYTQNIDTLESLAGLPSERVIEAHGSFASAHCLTCKKAHEREYILKAGVRDGKVVRCKDGCGGLVKPDIVFFGEGLPAVFFEHCSADLDEADLVLILGTSLEVNPVAKLPSLAHHNVPRILINRELVGEFKQFKQFEDLALNQQADASTSSSSRSTRSSRSSRSRPNRPTGTGSNKPGDVDALITDLSDVHLSPYPEAGSGSTSTDRTPSEEEPSSADERYTAQEGYYLGDADTAVQRLANLLGWGDELRGMIESGNAGLRREWGESGAGADAGAGAGAEKAGAEAEGKSEGGGTGKEGKEGKVKIDERQESSGLEDGPSPDLVDHARKVVKVTTGESAKAAKEGKEGKEGKSETRERAVDAPARINSRIEDVGGGESGGEGEETLAHKGEDEEQQEEEEAEDDDDDEEGLVSPDQIRQMSALISAQLARPRTTH